MTVTVSPVQWAELKDIDDVEPLNDSDSECLADVREVLARHGRLQRFGVALLHSHFELGSDEVLLESSDENARTLTLKPAKVEEASRNSVGTVWMLREGALATMSWCRSYCKKPEYWQATSHKKAHSKEKS